MSNILFEYDGIPVKYEKNKYNKTIINFIVVYTTGKNDFVKKKFKNFEEAMDFKHPEAILELKFISEDYLDGTNCELKVINYKKNLKLLDFEDKILLNYFQDKNFKFKIEIPIISYSLDLKFYPLNPKNNYDYLGRFTFERILFSKREKYKIEESFYDHFPNFENYINSPVVNLLFPEYSLELLFLLYVGIYTPHNFEKKKFEAHLMQTKKRYEELQNEKEESIIEEEIDFDTAEEISPEDSIILPISNEIPIVNDYINKDEVLYEIDPKINILNEKNNTKINALEIELNNLKELIEIGLSKNNNKINIIVFLFILVIIILFFLLKQLD